MSSVIVGIYGPRDSIHGNHPTFVHDHSFTIIRDDEIITSLPLERLTGIKHDNTIENHLLNFLYDYIDPNDQVTFALSNSFVGSSFISSDGNLRIEPNGEVTITSDLIPASVHWFPNGIDKKEAKGYIVCHEFAHIASSIPFFGEFPEKSLLVHIDGGASLSANSFWFYEKGTVNLLAHGWGELHSLICNFNTNPLVRAILSHESWQHLSIPGKLMGYASFGESSDETINWLRKNNWFKWMDENNENDRIKVLSTISEKFGLVKDFDLNAQIFMDICAAMQMDFQNTVTESIISYARKINAENLIFSGGAGLNILTNSNLETKNEFNSILIPPCTNDSGLSLGAAAWTYYKLKNKFIKSTSPFIVKTGMEAPESFTDIDDVIEMILQGDTIGICNGGGEIGPRALGHRSIIARMDDIEIRKHVSENIKKREWYRPLAPIMCEEAAEVVLPEALNSNLSKFMLGSWIVPDEWKSYFAGVIHIDGSIRCQIIRRKDNDNKWMYELLRRLWKEHNIPGLINTSFNKMGEPILIDGSKAIHASKTLNLEGVVINGSLHKH